MEETHYERCMKFRAPPGLLEKHGGDVGAACMELANTDHELAILTTVIDYVRPACKGSFLELVDSHEGRSLTDYLGRVILALGRNPNEHAGIVSTQLMVAWQACRFENAGKRAYVVSPGFQRRLLATELRGLRCSDIRLPYPCMYVCVDKSAGFRVYNEQTGWHELYGMYLTEDAGGLRVMICGDRSPDRDEYDDALSHFHMDLSSLPDAPVAKIIEDLRKTVMGKDGDWFQSQGMTGAEIDELVGTWTHVFNWAMALVFYLTHGDPDVEHVEMNEELRALYRRRKKAKGTKLKKIAERIRGQRSHSRIIVGRHMAVDKRLPKTASEARALMVKTLVAGHWQRYAVGPGRQERKWKFREPFWRGAGEEGPSVHEVR